MGFRGSCAPKKVDVFHILGRQHSAFNPLNAELNPICHLLALLGGATIVVVSWLRVNSEAMAPLSPEAFSLPLSLKFACYVLWSITIMRL